MAVSASRFSAAGWRFWRTAIESAELTNLLALVVSVSRFSMEEEAARCWAGAASAADATRVAEAAAIVESFISLDFYCIERFKLVGAVDEWMRRYKMLFS